MPSPADVPSRRSGSTRTTTRRRALDRRQEQSAPVFGVFRDRLIPAALLVYTAAVTLWMALSAPEEGAARWIRALAPVVVAITAVVLAWHTSRVPAFDRGTRRFWKGVAVAVALSTVAHLLATLVVRPLSPAVADLIGVIIPLLAELALLAAFRHLPSAPPSGVPRTTLALDLSMVGVTGALVAWYGIAMHNPVSDPVPDFALLHAHATLEVMGLLIAFVWWRRTLLQRRAQVLMLFAAALLVRALAHAVAIVQMTFDLTKVDVVAIAEPVSLALIAAAAWFSLATVMHRQVRVRRERVTVLATVLPFVMVLPGFVLLLAYGMSEVPEAGSPVSLLGLVAGLLVLTALAFARQFTSTEDIVQALAETTARTSEARFQALVQHSSDVIMILDPDGTIRYASPSTASVFGHDPVKLVSTGIESILHPEDLPFTVQFLEELAQSIRTRAEGETPGVLKREWRIRHANGAWLTVDNVGTNLLDEPVIRGLVLNTRDVTEQSVIKQQYMHQAFHDPLTDLANRTLFLYQVGHALARAQRQMSAVTVLFLDLDNFKTVNDSLGHAAGDRLLVEAARRLATCVRDSDLIARLGGDEFAVLVEGTASVDEVLVIASRIGVALRRPFLVGGTEVFVNASIGISRSTQGESTDELVRNADVAMYVAKTRGKGQHALFEMSMHEAALDRLVVEADLRRAIEHEEFMLQYQPIVALDTGDIIGAEALVRWICRDRGKVPPGLFIPIAEETGLIVQIGRWVLRRACHEAKRWTDERGLPVRISVNLSGRQLQEAGIVEDVRQALEDSGLAPEQLVLEITESMLMNNTDLSMTRLNELKALGISLAIDDFGTGYSSLSYLQRYPIDILKIDKAFVDVIDKGGDGPVLASAIVALGETLRMNTVAEGIETEAQRGHLLSLGCELGQGYLFAPPLDAEDFWHLLLTRGARAPYATLRRRDMSVKAA